MVEIPALGQRASHSDSTIIHQSMDDNPAPGQRAGHPDPTFITFITFRRMMKPFTGSKVRSRQINIHQLGYNTANQGT